MSDKLEVAEAKLSPSEHLDNASTLDFLKIVQARNSELNTTECMTNKPIHKERDYEMDLFNEPKWAAHKEERARTFQKIENALGKLSKEYGGCVKSSDLDPIIVKETNMGLKKLVSEFEAGKVTSEQLNQMFGQFAKVGLSQAQITAINEELAGSKYKVAVDNTKGQGPSYWYPPTYLILDKDTNSPISSWKNPVTPRRAR